MYYRVNAFTKALADSVTLDSSLSWLEHRKVHMNISAGLRPKKDHRWGVRIRSAVGDPFLGLWKEHLLTLARRRQRRRPAEPSAPGAAEGQPKRHKPNPPGSVGPGGLH